MVKKTISNTFVVNTIIDGDSFRQIYSYQNSTPVVPQENDQSDSYLPINWSEVPLDLDRSHRYVYISVRHKVNGTWGSWSTPVIFTYLAEDGRSISIKGAALKHYDTWDEFTSDSSKVVGQTYLVDENSNEEPRPWIVVWSSGATGSIANQDDAYIVQEDGCLYLATDTISGWTNAGQIKGDKGDQGKIGRFFYYAGVFNASDNTKTFVVNDAQAPYFAHTSALLAFSVFNPENPTSNSYTMAQMWALSHQSWNEPWEVMTNDYKYLITEAIFAEFARLDAFYFAYHFMFSAYGRHDNAQQDNAYDASWDTYDGIDGVDNDWTPNCAIDATNGVASFAKDKVRFNADGSGWLADKQIQWGNNKSFSLSIGRTNGSEVNTITISASPTTSPSIKGLHTDGFAFELAISSNGGGLRVSFDAKKAFVGLESEDPKLFLGLTNSSGNSGIQMFVDESHDTNTLSFLSSGQSTPLEITHNFSTNSLTINILASSLPSYNDANTGDVYIDNGFLKVK